jgi:hypothetical protein
MDDEDRPLRIKSALLLMGVLPVFLGAVIWLNQPDPDEVERERWERAQRDRERTEWMLKNLQDQGKFPEVSPPQQTN